jgi:hypothetical protein
MPGPAALLAAGARRLSWAQILWLSKEALERGSAVGRELGPNGRARALELVRKSNGRPGNLTPREREELRKLAMTVWDAAVHPERH